MAAADGREAGRVRSGGRQRLCAHRGRRSGVDRQGLLCVERDLQARPRSDDLPGYREKKAIVVGDGCQVGLAAVIEAGARLDSYAVVGTQTYTVADTRVPTHTTAVGVPTTFFAANPKSMHNMMLVLSLRHTHSSKRCMEALSRAFPCNSLERGCQHVCECAQD